MQAVGVWVGLAVSLSLFSLIWKEHWLSRLVQHVLVGATTGWILILVWHTLLQPRLVVPWLQGRFTWGNTIPVILCLILILGALTPRAQATGTPTVDRILQGTASLISAFLVTAALTTGLIGIWQGTVIPQILIGVIAAYGLPIALILTALVLLHQTVRTDRLRPLPPYLTTALQFAHRLGHPLLMLVSGMVLARLLTSRLVLLTAFLERTLYALQDSGLWEQLQIFLPWR